MQTDLIWETRYGEQIPLSKMEARHIFNCIAKIRIHWPWRAQYLEHLKQELARRGLKDVTIN